MGKHENMEHTWCKLTCKLNLKKLCYTFKIFGVVYTYWGLKMKRDFEKAILIEFESYLNIKYMKLYLFLKFFN